ncbi:MAG TPA: tetratricopeptide repeat protein, partial [Longimicrobium sp.]
DLGRAPQAIERFRAAIVQDSTSARAWAGLVSALRRSGRPAQAERVLARAPVEVRSLITSVRADTAVYVPPMDTTRMMGPPSTTPNLQVPTTPYVPDTTGTIPAPVMQP